MRHGGTGLGQSRLYDSIFCTALSKRRNIADIYLLLHKALKSDNARRTSWEMSVSHKGKLQDTVYLIFR
jgi:hypothetical protein